MGAHSNGNHTKRGQRPHEWVPPQCKYYCSVNHSDQADLTNMSDRSCNIIDVCIHVCVSVTTQSALFLRYPATEVSLCATLTSQKGGFFAI